MSDRVWQNRACIGIAVSWAGYVAFRIAQESIVLGDTRYYGILDDALISMRYAWNLVEGNGLVWTPGERVEGYTNPLLVMIFSGCLLVASKTGAVLLAQILGALWAAGAAWMAAGLLGDLLERDPVALRGVSWAPLTVGVAVLLYYPLFILSFQGMETGLLTLVLLAGLRLAIRGPSNRQLLVLSGLLALAYLCRPDAALPAAVVLGSMVLRGGRPLACFGPFLAIVALHLLARYGYYGEWLPNTYALKIAGVPTLDRVADGLAVGRLFLQESWPLLLLAGAGAFRSREHRLVAAVALVQLAYHVYAGGDFLPDLWRFAVPGMPLVFALAADASMRGWERWRGATTGTTFVPLLVLTAALVFTSQRYGGRWIEDYEKRSRQTRLDLIIARAVTRLTTSDARVGVIRAGIVPYYSGRPALDFLGKMDPHIARTAPHRDVVPGMTKLGSRMWPGHAKYDLHYSIALQQPDVVQRMRWFDDDQRVWGRKHYSRLMLGKVALHLRKDSDKIHWGALRCRDGICTERSAADQ